MYVCVDVCMRLYACMHVLMAGWVYVCICMCACLDHVARASLVAVCVYVCMRVYVCMPMHVCILKYVCMHACVNAYVQHIQVCMYGACALLMAD